MAYTKAKISIPNVTGDIVITATAVPSVPSYTNLFIPGDAQVNKRFSSSGSISSSDENGSVVVGNYIDVSSIDKANGIISISIFLNSFFNSNNLFLLLATKIKSIFLLAKYLAIGYPIPLLAPVINALIFLSLQLIIPILY